MYVLCVLRTLLRTSTGVLLCTVRSECTLYFMSLPLEEQSYVDTTSGVSALCTTSRVPLIAKS